MRYAGLAYLMSCYFHQDWIVEGRDSPAVVETFRVENSADDVQRAARDLEELLLLEDEEIDRVVFEELKPYYLPGPSGQTTRQWLQEIHDQLSPPRRA